MTAILTWLGGEIAYPRWAFWTLYLFAFAAVLVLLVVFWCLIENNRANADLERRGHYRSVHYRSIFADVEKNVHLSPESPLAEDDLMSGRSSRMYGQVVIGRGTRVDHGDPR